MDFHDFPSFFPGKSGCQSHSPAQVMCRPTAREAVFVQGRGWDVRGLTVPQLVGYNLARAAVTPSSASRLFNQPAVLFGRADYGHVRCMGHFLF